MSSNILGREKLFIARDGTQVVLRPPRTDDIDGFLELDNSALSEDLDMERRRAMGREEATALLQDLLARIANREALALVAVAGSKIASFATVMRWKELSSHVGEFGIGTVKGYRRIGIGTAMLQEFITSSRGLGLKILVVRTFASNIGMRKVLEQSGFKEVGQLPKIYEKRGRYIDEIIATLEL
jgi:RimJ/RimL family protein N-acetyltransferase